MNHADIDGVKLHYEVHGDGPPVLLSYCLGGNLRMLRPEARVLAQRYRVILWDPRGHGHSDSPADPRAYGVSRSASDLARLLDHLGLERAHVGGLSMGGGIAARFAQLFPQRALSLAIVDSNTAAAQPVSQQVREVREQTAALCDAGDMQAAARYYLANSPAYRLYAADSEDNRARLQEMVAATNPRGFANTLRAMLAPDSSLDDLQRITAPTLLVAGESDPGLAVIRLTHEHITGSVMELIPGAGHLSNIDAPEALQGVLMQFLDRVHGKAFA